MTHIFILNEVTLLRFLILALRRKQVEVLAVTAIIPPFQGLLETVSRWALTSERASHVVDRFPELRPYWEYDRRFHFHEAFKKYEPWQNKYYDFDRTQALGQIYGFGYKLIIANCVFPRTLDIHLLEVACRKPPKDGHRIYGIVPDTLDMCRSYFNAEAAPGVRAMWVPARLINTLITIAVGLFSLLWITSRIRPLARTEPVFVVADNVNAPCDFLMYEELEEGGEIVLEIRNAKAYGDPLPGHEKYTMCHPRDGFFGLAGALAAMAMIVGGMVALWRRCTTITPSIYFRLIAMPFKRAVIRGLLNRYRPKFYWGRDDYNIEHILRRDELHRVGATSLGVSHGVYTNFCSLMPQFRYISYDIYYGFSTFMCQPYLSRWAQDMELRSAGLNSLSRQTIAAPWPLGENILITSRVAWYDPEMRNIARAVASAFPELKVLVQMKPGYIDDETIKEMVNEWCRDIPNMEHVTDGIYDLLTRTRYLVSDISSLIGEALQLGIPTLFADVIEMEYSIFRKFPDLSFKTADDVVKRLKSLDSGETPYPHEEYLKIMDLDHRLTVFDLVRKDVGLPPLKKLET